MASFKYRNNVTEIMIQTMQLYIWWSLCDANFKHTDCITCISWTKDRCFNHHHQFLLQSNLLAYLHNSSASAWVFVFYNIHTAPDIQSCNDILKTSEQLLGLAYSSKELDCTGLIDHQMCNRIWQESEDEGDLARLFFPNYSEKASPEYVKS